MFCIAIPNETATAPANEICATPFSAPANTTPTAIPSGRLWIVTARASIAVLERLERIPSGLSVPICRCGVSSSMSSRNPIPSKNPTAAGITAHLPISAPISMDGISSDQTDAATITPEAKPKSDFCNLADISSFIKNTKADPSIVPSSGISSPIINVVVINRCKGTKKRVKNNFFLSFLIIVNLYIGPSI